MSKTVLITGATGLIGNSLTEILLKRGFTIHHLTRNLTRKVPNVKTFKWDISKMQIDERCIENVDAIINLAGEPIIGKAWTAKRKQQITTSRTGSLKLLNDILSDNLNHTVKTLISTSAVGYYGDRKDELLSEESETGTDFLANTCLAWEQAADKIRSLGIRLVKFRIGVVLSSDGGALPKMDLPVKLGFGAALGTGKQWVPWIHLEDVANMFLHALENDTINGSYNMTAPHPITNKELTKAIAKQLHKRLWLPRVPEVALKLMMGEMSSVVLNSTNTSSSKISASGFAFKYPEIEAALRDIYGRKSS